MTSVIDAEQNGSTAGSAAEFGVLDDRDRRTRRSRNLSFGHVLMLIAGVIGFGLTMLVLNQDSQTVQVAVAVDDLPTGTDLTEGAFEITDFPANSEFGTQFATAERLAGESMRLVQPVAAGAPIPLTALVASGGGAERSEFSVPVQSDKLPGGGLAIGDRVHVLAVISQSGTTYSTFVATDVEVVAVPGSGRSGALAGTTGGDFVTIALTEDQLLTVTAAQGLGDLELARTNAAAPPVNVDRTGVGTQAGVIVVLREALISAQEAEADLRREPAEPNPDTTPEPPPLDADDVGSEAEPESGGPAGEGDG